MANPLFKVVGNSGTSKPTNNPGVITTSEKMVKGDDIASIFQNGLKMLAQNNGLSENASAKDILEALTKAASNGNGEGFSYSVNDSYNAEVVDEYKGPKEEKIKDDKDVTANKSNGTQTTNASSILQQFIKFLQQLAAKSQEE